MYRCRKCFTKLIDNKCVTHDLNNEFTFINGLSDDIIEFSGFINDELECYDKDIVLEFSDSTKLKIHYGKENKAIWNIDVVNQGSGFIEKRICENEEDFIYSDIVFIKKDIVLTKTELISIKKDL